MKHIFFISLIALISLESTPVIAQENQQNDPNFPKLDASPMDLAQYAEDGEVMARVIYSRPQKRDREIFGNLVPYGEVWRTGANEATELTLYEDMEVADVVVEAGTYTIYTIPEEKEWTVILNNEVNTWGAYEYKETEDQVRIKAPVRRTSNEIESFSMAFAPKEGEEEGANLLMGWDDSYVQIPFKPVN